MDWITLEILCDDGVAELTLSKTEALGLVKEVITRIEREAQEDDAPVVLTLVEGGDEEAQADDRG